MSITDRLFTIRYKCDDIPHLAVIDQQVCRQCAAKPCNYFCPSDVYEWDEAGQQLRVAYENCLECGSCRIACPEHNIDWQYTRGGYGISYKFG